ncbi:SDR family NAD(P)-dependent oxidoreductase [Schinkia azotoformans]|uniref:SDR family NAD(P)-dependent oxidoreductase n=1 Tax=Schinkia azotoformans TaxID=1454 RepID=UPI002DB727E7|nr:SDR family NAD(P)-dependent oxidoreductase [Schinkia azotoformans]MEC1760388.1 SDR family NAD(P)-dependent oxidoreductase [Schinkia azotoformans]
MEGKKALVVGGTSGIGLAMALELEKRGYNKIYIIGRSYPDTYIGESIEFVRFNLLSDDFSLFQKFEGIDTLIISAGFGRVAPFEDIGEVEIINNFKVNTVSAIRIIKIFYNKLSGNKNFYCTILGSIAGLISSPLFSVYGATKAALCKFIESINIELEKTGSPNRILNVSPGSVNGTKFNSDFNDLSLIEDLAKEITNKMFEREIIFIPNFDEIYKGVLRRYQTNPYEFGIESYEYKKQSGRINVKPQIKIGYLSGTFDLFHIGHLNLLRRAKEYCDYLVVGVHKDGSHKKKELFIPFNERLEIVKNIKYVDKVIQSLPEDDAVYNLIKYDFLFVGSDYKGTDRFNRYEEYFKDKGVKIIYFPYTEGTSSTQLRNALDKLSVITK